MLNRRITFRQGAQFWVLQALVAVLSYPVVAAEETKEVQQARKEVQSAYYKEDMAVKNKDFDAYWSWHSENFFALNKKGQRMTTNEVKEGVDIVFNRAESLKGYSLIEKFTLKGNKATATLRCAYTFVFRREDDKKDIIEGTGRYEESMVKLKGKWWKTSSKTLAEHHILNGKSVKTDTIRLNR